LTCFSKRRLKQKEAGSGVRVLSWNLWWRHGPWERRREAIAATMVEVRPDLCGLQEVWSAPGESLSADLAERLGMHWCWAAAAKSRGPGSGEISIGNAILSRWPIIAHVKADLPVDDVVGEGRVAVHAVGLRPPLRVPRTGAARRGALQALGDVAVRRHAGG
jgi:endonuclease/exonuclease/phosphatase family metal-dependent hydrolase